MLNQEEGGLKKIKDHFIHLTVHEGASSGQVRQGKKDRSKDKAPVKVNEGQIHKEQKFSSVKDWVLQEKFTKKQGMVQKERYLLCFHLF